MTDIQTRLDNIPPERRLYALWDLPRHLAASEQKRRLHRLLLNFNWMEAKLDATDVNALIADYDLLTNDKTIRLVQSAIRMSSHIIAEDKGQLPSQLLGHLPHHEVPAIERTTVSTNRPWLRPIVASLAHPSTGLLRTFIGHIDEVTAVAIASDNLHLLSGSADRTLRIWDVEQGKQIAVLHGHTGRISSLTLTQDGHRAISGSFFFRCVRVI